MSDYEGEYKNWETENASIVLMNEAIIYRLSQRLRRELSNVSNDEFIVVLGIYLKEKSRKLYSEYIAVDQVEWKEVAEDFLQRLIEEGNLD